jgi:hypothetical protein
MPFSMGMDILSLKLEGTFKGITFQCAELNRIEKVSIAEMLTEDETIKCLRA